jgi:phage-related protein
MIGQYLYFNFDGESSQIYNIASATTNTGLFEEFFVASKSIVEKKVPGRSKPYLQSVERDPLELPLTLYFEKGFTEDDLHKVKRWIDTDDYQEFYFEEIPNRRVFAMLSGDSSLLHNGAAVNQGYFNVTMRCNNAYIFSPEYLDNVIDLSTNDADGTEITFENKSDLNLHPECWIEKIGAGDVSIENLSNGGEIFEFIGLENGETVYVDNFNEDIISDIPGIYRYDSHNNVFLEFVYGVNRLKCLGDFKIQFRYFYIFK